MQYDEEERLAEPESRERAQAGRHGARRADPVTRGLVVGIMIVVILTLLAVTYVLYAGLFGPRAPRTAVERQIQVLETYTSENPSSVFGWADYVKALTLTEQHVKARQVLDEVAGMVEVEPLLMIEEARLLIETGVPDRALEWLDQAISVAEETRKAELEDLASRGVSGMIADPYATWITTASILKIGIYQEQGDWQMVVEVASDALEQSPTMADVLTVRGFAHVELGDADSAEEDFRAALELIPDYQEALDGLERIGAESGGSDE